MIDPVAVQFRQALDLLDELTAGLLPMAGIAGVYRDRVELWKKTARSLVNDHLKAGHMGNSTGEKVAAIKEAWREASTTAVVDLDLMATVAINVLTDWDKRPSSKVSGTAGTTIDQL